MNSMKSRRKKCSRSWALILIKAISVADSVILHSICVSFARSRQPLPRIKGLRAPRAATKFKQKLSVDSVFGPQSSVNRRDILIRIRSEFNLIRNCADWRASELANASPHRRKYTNNYELRSQPECADEFSRPFLPPGKREQFVTSLLLINKFFGWKFFRFCRRHW